MIPPEGIRSTVRSRSPGIALGSALARIERQELDLHPYMAAGGPGIDDGGPFSPGHVYLWDVTTHSAWGFHFPIAASLGPSAGGASLVDAEDLDGNGYADVLYGSPLAGPDGSGDARGVVRAHAVVVDAEDFVRVWGTEPGARFGAALVALDADGDGLREFFGAAPDTRSAEAPHVGAVWRIPRSEMTAGDHVVHDVADAVVYGRGAGDALGHSLASAGDLDGDGLPELWIGAPGADGERGATGAAYAVPAAWSGAAVAADIAPVTLLGVETGGRFGAAVVGDARPSAVPAGVAVGAPDEGGRGAVRAYDLPLWGRITTAEATATWLGAPGSAFGSALIWDADIEADGLEDLVVAAPLDREARGSVWRLPPP
jgi:hypothetical protein